MIVINIVLVNFLVYYHPSLKYCIMHLKYFIMYAVYIRYVYLRCSTEVVDDIKNHMWCVILKVSYLVVNL